MKNFAFISRHLPTDDQIALAEAQNISITNIGDADAFTVSNGFVDNAGAFDGVIVVHPAAAMRLADSFMIGVFENANRAPLGEKPDFKAIAFHIYDLRS